ncbi:hypothetical protein [Bacillus albus]|nr:hypothetical protein [Bacillus albus]
MVEALLAGANSKERQPVLSAGACCASWKITDQVRVPFCDTAVATPK